MSDSQPPPSGLARFRARLGGRVEAPRPSPEAEAIHARVDQLSKLELRDVMTPRVDAVFLTIPVTPEAIAEAVRDTGHSCFPAVRADPAEAPRAADPPRPAEPAKPPAPPANPEEIPASAWSRASRPGSRGSPACRTSRCSPTRARRVSSPACW